MLGSKRKFAGNARISGVFGAAGCVYQVIFLAAAEPWVPILISPWHPPPGKQGSSIREKKRFLTTDETDYHG